MKERLSRMFPETVSLSKDVRKGVWKRQPWAHLSRVTGNPGGRGHWLRNQEVGAGAQKEPMTELRRAENKTNTGWEMKIRWRRLRDKDWWPRAGNKKGKSVWHCLLGWDGTEESSRAVKTSQEKWIEKFHPCLRSNWVSTQCRAMGFLFCFNLLLKNLRRFHKCIKRTLLRLKKIYH